jgi:mono/diheme cytochrome c family protein
VAWRAVANGSKILLLHQAAQVDSIELVNPLVGAGGESDSGASSPYGSGQCSAVVRATLSQIDADGTTWTGGTIGMGTLPIDFDVSAAGRVAVAFAGSGGGRAPGGGKFMDEPAMFAVFASDMLPAVAMDQGSGGAGGNGADSNGAAGDGASVSFGDCMTATNSASIPEPVVAVRFAPQDPNRLFLLTRNPSRLYRVDGPNFDLPTTIELGGSDVTDTGHAIFHDDAGRGIACASCHPEGTEDGHVWTFSGVGARRTQALNTDLGETAPFHWDGALADVGQLMDEVFVKRMGGEHESAERLATLERWLFALPSLPPLRAADDEAAKRGAELFASAEVACATCHAGPALSNSQSFKVGTDPTTALQVPSLLGVSHRAPFIHTGCAATLLGRFDPGCGGGEEHGHTAQLSAEQLDDLVAYLESL